MYEHTGERRLRQGLLTHAGKSDAARAVVARAAFAGRRGDAG